MKRKARLANMSASKKPKVASYDKVDVREAFGKLFNNNGQNQAKQKKQWKAGEPHWASYEPALPRTEADEQQIKPGEAVPVLQKLLQGLMEDDDNMYDGSSMLRSIVAGSTYPSPAVTATLHKSLQDCTRPAAVEVLTSLLSGVYKMVPVEGLEKYVMGVYSQLVHTGSPLGSVWEAMRQDISLTVTDLQTPAQDHGACRKALLSLRLMVDVLWRDFTYCLQGEGRGVYHTVAERVLCPSVCGGTKRLPSAEMVDFIVATLSMQRSTMQVAVFRELMRTFVLLLKASSISCTSRPSTLLAQLANQLAARGSSDTSVKVLLFYLDDPEYRLELTRHMKQASAPSGGEENHVSPVTSTRDVKVLGESNERRSGRNVLKPISPVVEEKKGDSKGTVHCKDCRIVRRFGNDNAQCIMCDKWKKRAPPVTPSDGSATTNTGCKDCAILKKYCRDSAQCIMCNPWRKNAAAGASEKGGLGATQEVISINNW